MKWKQINLYGKLYFVSNTGLIKGLKRNLILKPYLSSGGYEYICIHEGHHSHHIRVHRLVAEAFVPNPNKYKCINHKDGNKHNNNANNLEWCTYSDNIKHGFQNGLYNIKLPKCHPINQYDLSGNFIKTWNSMKDVEKSFNVSHTALRFCCLNKIKSCKGLYGDMQMNNISLLFCIDTIFF